VLFLNTAHRFFRDLRVGPGTNPRLRAGLEVLLFVIGDAELDAEGDRRLFYETERSVWSQQPNVALDRLDQNDSAEDVLSAAEDAEVEASKGGSQGAEAAPAA
jgi:hypothetical protein